MSQYPEIDRAEREAHKRVCHTLFPSPPCERHDCAGKKKHAAVTALASLARAAEERAEEDARLRIAVITESQEQRARAEAAEARSARWAERYEQAMKQADEHARALEARVRELEAKVKRMATWAGATGD